MTPVAPPQVTVHGSTFFSSSWVCPSMALRSARFLGMPPARIFWRPGSGWAARGRDRTSAIAAARATTRRELFMGRKIARVADGE
jgi:hypothetical protein